MGILSDFEYQAHAHPDKVLFSSPNEKYTFGEALSSAKRLAAAIPQTGSDRPCAVFCSRNACVPMLMLAVLYSGHFYVPVDPDLPETKLRSILSQADPCCILGEEAFRTTAETVFPGCMFITAADRADAPAAFAEPSSSTPLFAVYTSGSTGTPKGVLKTYGAMESFLNAYCGTFGFSGDEIIGNQTPFFFDAAAKDLYLALKLGMTLEIIPTEKFAMPTTLIEYLNERKISFISWVPTAYAIVAQLRTFSFIKPQYLRRAFFVGETMPMKHLNYWRNNLPDVQYVNLYGQSELAGVCCYYEIRGAFSDEEILPVGKCLPNCRVRLIKDGAPVRGAGEIGEIFIESAALAAGYLNDAEKTAQSFVSFDFGDGPVRCFKTGDLARRDENGDLVFVSRNDFQIKHLGHRIELGEIEAAAGALEGVERCCALYDGSKQAIVLFAQGDADKISLKRQLRQRLASYMMPEKIVLLEKLPLNPNGKIDRVKLTESLKK